MIFPNLQPPPLCQQSLDFALILRMATPLKMSIFEEFPSPCIKCVLSAGFSVFS